MALDKADKTDRPERPSSGNILYRIGAGMRRRFFGTTETAKEKTEHSRREEPAIRLTGRINAAFIYEGKNVLCALAQNGKAATLKLPSMEMRDRWDQAMQCIAHNERVIAACRQRETDVKRERKGDLPPKTVKTEVDTVWEGVTPLIAPHRGQLDILQKNITSLLGEAAQRESADAWAPEDAQHARDIDEILRFWVEKKMRMPEPAWLITRNAHPHAADRNTLKQAGLEEA